jgi:hypothetical protein
MSVAAPVSATSIPARILRGDLRWYQNSAPVNVSRLQLRVDVLGRREWKILSSQRGSYRRAPSQSLPQVRRESPSTESARSWLQRIAERGANWLTRLL